MAKVIVDLQFFKKKKKTIKKISSGRIGGVYSVRNRYSRQPCVVILLINKRVIRIINRPFGNAVSAIKSIPYALSQEFVKISGALNHASYPEAFIGDVKIKSK